MGSRDVASAHWRTDMADAIAPPYARVMPPPGMAPAGEPVNAFEQPGG